MDHPLPLIGTAHKNESVSAFALSASTPVTVIRALTATEFCQPTIMVDSSVTSHFYAQFREVNTSNEQIAGFFSTAARGDIERAGRLGAGGAGAWQPVGQQWKAAVAAGSAGDTTVNTIFGSCAGCAGESRSEVVAALLDIAESATDFLGDLAHDGREARVVTAAIAQAADIYEDATGYVADTSDIAAARMALTVRAWKELAARETDAADALADAMDAGDVDRSGRFVPWERYP